MEQHAQAGGAPRASGLCALQLGQDFATTPGATPAGAIRATTSTQTTVMFRFGNILSPSIIHIDSAGPNVPFNDNNIPGHAPGRKFLGGGRRAPAKARHALTNPSKGLWTVRIMIESPPGPSRA